MTGAACQGLLLAGNMHQARLRFGRYDANYGVVLQGNGKGGLSYVPQNRSGLQLQGNVRSILSLQDQLVFGLNQQKLRAYRLRKPGKKDLLASRQNPQ